MPASVYPARVLKESLPVPRAIVEKSSGRPMRRLRLAEALDERPESGKFRAQLTSSRAYGLTEGSREAKNIELTELGARVVAGKVDAVLEALLSVPLFSTFYTEYESKVVPAEGVLKDYLRDDCGVPAKQVDHAYGGILQDARDWGLVQESAGAERVLSWDMARERAGSQLRAVGVPMAEPVEPTATEPAREEPLARGRVDIERGIQLNIEIHIAADTSEERIEAIFKNMKKYLLSDE
jgi:hypothetical protein